MNFYIRRNSILPTLRMKLVFDGRNDYKRFHDLLENAIVTFSMKNENGIYKVANKEGTITKVTNNENDEYYVEYQWEVNDTNELGVFTGEFKVKFLDDCSHVIVPIRDDLFINVLTSFTKGDIQENNNIIEGLSNDCLIYCDNTFTGGTVSGHTEFINGVTITSTTQGFLPPRMTGVEAELITPQIGLVIYSLDNSGVTINQEGLWINKSGGWTFIG